MRIVLLGDMHLYRLFLPPWQMLSKRMLGQTNLWLNRRHRFNRGLMDGVIQQVKAVEPDLLLLSGDISTTALAGEFLDASEILRPLTERFPTVIVPGNHDRYTFSAARRRLMEQLMPGLVPHEWPHYRKLGGCWHMLALDGSVPRLLNARGRVGNEQLRGVRERCASLTHDDGLVVLCHYPLKSPPRALPLTWDHKVAYSFLLRRALTRCKARLLYMHGHIHAPWCWQPRRSNQSHFTYINAGSPTMVGKKYPKGQGFWQVDLPDKPLGHLRVVHHLPGKVAGGAEDDWVAKQVL